MSPVHQVLKFDKVKENHYGWMLSTPQRDYSIYATEEKDRNDWMVAIQVVLDNATMTERVLKKKNIPLTHFIVQKELTIHKSLPFLSLARASSPQFQFQRALGIASP